MAKFNDETIGKILVYRENGLSLKSCASLAGIDESTLHRWISKGREAKRGRYRDFYINLERANAKFEVYHLKKVTEDETWQSSAWILERTFSERYGRKDSVKQDVTHKGTVEIKPLKERVKEYADFFGEIEQELEKSNRHDDTR